MPKAAVAERRILLDRIRERETSRRVVFVGDTGTMPLELPGEIDAWHRDVNGKVISREEYRPFEFGAGGRMELDPSNDADAAFIGRARKLLRMVADGSHYDPRIAAKGVREVNPQQPAQPFRRWDDLKPEVVLEMAANMMGDDHAENLALLESMLEYELYNQNRAEVVDGLEMLASEPPVEAAPVEADE